MSRDRRARVYMQHDIARWQQLLNYNGRGDVSSARALGAIINVTRTYVPIFIYCARALRAGKQSFFRCAVTEIKVVNHASEAYS